MDPENSELSRLLQTAKDKFLEVGGGCGSASFSSASVVAGSEIVLSGEAVPDCSELLLPTASDSSAWELIGEGQLLEYAHHPAGTAGFVRVGIVSDDEDNQVDEHAENVTSTPSQTPSAGFSRVAIVEESDSDSDSEVEAAVSPLSAEVLKDRGNELLKAGKVAEAIEAYSESLNVEKCYVSALNNRAQAYLLNEVRAESSLSSNCSYCSSSLPLLCLPMSLYTKL